MTPTVSIILPTYNRARFLDDAFESIAGQTLADWELIVVDDGSTDQTRDVVDRWRRRFERRLKYVWRENGGAYAARNTGLDHAGSALIAFFDSDDLWLPYHLERSVNALHAHPEIDWVFSACRLIDPSGTVVQETAFEANGRPRLFRSLATSHDGDLRIITDRRRVFHASARHLPDS
jgi:glycosyltransferase involved in cell wall biosynthesis